jgi:hypothetical protein
MSFVAKDAKKYAQDCRGRLNSSGAKYMENLALDMVGMAGGQARYKNRTDDSSLGARVQYLTLINASVRRKKCIHPLPRG